MGTRNLTCVYRNNQYKVAKYCQWDGYPEGKGQDIVEFLTTKYDPSKFREQVDKVKELSESEIEQRWKEAGSDGSEFVTLDVVDVFKQNGNSHLDRDMGGAELLEYIQATENPEVPPSSLDFAADSLFCEWCYVLDLDKDALEIYKGFNTKPLNENERFYFLREDISNTDPSFNKRYNPVCFLKSFSLKNINKLKQEWNVWLEKSLEERE